MIKNKPESFSQLINKYNDLKEAVKGNGYINYKKRNFKISADIRPTPSSRSYKIEFYYKLNGMIDVYACNLLMMDNKFIPHIYKSKYPVNRKARLCLYMPKYKEYDSRKLLTENILPWTYEWLYFYELFLITDIWYGNGVHPNIRRSH